MLDYSRHVTTGEDYIYHDIQKNIDMTLHAHATYELLYCYEGFINVTILDRIYRVSSGKFILIAPNEVHSYDSPDYNKVYICNFSSSYIKDFYIKYKDSISLFPLFSMLSAETFIKNLIAEKEKYALCSMLYQVVSNFIKHTAFVPLDKKKNDLLKDVTNYIIKNLSNDVSLKKLAEVFGYSYNYLSTIVNNAFETNFMEVVNSYRINRATDLINNSDKSITEIAKEVGYDSIRTFNRNYKKYKNITPTESRETLKNGIIIDI